MLAKFKTCIYGLKIGKFYISYSDTKVFYPVFLYFEMVSRQILFVLSQKFPQERYFLNYTKLTLPLFYGSHDYSLYLHLSTCGSIGKETVHFRRTFCHDYRVLL